jgi:hypothetical protein
MRTLIFVVAVIGCGDNTTDNGSNDMAVPVIKDMAMAPDGMTPVTPFNMPGKVDCYQGLTCTVGSASPICCDAKVDGGTFTDTCVASSAACTASDPKATAYECGQAADCGAGKICCGDIGTSMTSGKKFFRSTSCQTACPGMQTQLCVTAGECKTGTMCTGASISGRDVGLCM